MASLMQHSGVLWARCVTLAHSCTAGDTFYLLWSISWAQQSLLQQPVMLLFFISWWECGGIAWGTQR